MRNDLDTIDGREGHAAQRDGMLVTRNVDDAETRRR